jgi:methionine-rich copper-binding protein CopC
LPAPAWAQEIVVLQSAPKARAVIGEPSSEFFVRFDRPIDHTKSTLSIYRNDTRVERLVPRLDSAPDVLFARAPTLSPGSYTLRWAVSTPTGATVLEGSIPFTVKAQQ